jgi:hypothetical protein
MTATLDIKGKPVTVSVRKLAYEDSIGVQVEWGPEDGGQFDQSAYIAILRDDGVLEVCMDAISPGDECPLKEDPKEDLGYIQVEYEGDTNG